MDMETGNGVDCADDITTQEDCAAADGEWYNPQCTELVFTKI